MIFGHFIFTILSSMQLWLAVLVVNSMSHYALLELRSLLVGKHSLFIRVMKQMALCIEHAEPERTARLWF